jgi:hypothetical protein
MPISGTQRPVLKPLTCMPAPSEERTKTLTFVEVVRSTDP